MNNKSTKGMSIDYLALLRGQFDAQVYVEEKRPGILQLFLPAWQGDGDMVAIYLESIIKDGEEWIRISDYASTIMHVFDVDVYSPEGSALLQKVVARSMICEDGGNLFLDVKPEDLLDGVFHFVQAATRVHEIGTLKE